MDQMTGSMKASHWGVLTAIFSTALLFSALPLLTHHQTYNPPTKNPGRIYITPYKPPPPPEIRDLYEKPEIIKKMVRPDIEKTKRSKPKFDVPNTGIDGNFNQKGWIEINVAPQEGIKFPTRAIPYNPDEVDEPPRYLRTIPAQYPYHAKRDNIEGNVLLRFVVDLDGRAKEAEVVRADPEGVFEDAALKAIARYKFKPAIKDGNAVKCNAALTITFAME